MASTAEGIEKRRHLETHGGYSRIDGPQASNGKSLANSLASYTKIALLTEGSSVARKAKTAISMLRYRCEDIAAVVDSHEAGRTAGEVFGVGGKIPFVASLAALSEIDALFLGTAPAGGKFPANWRLIVRQAVDRGIDVISGLHEFLSEDEELKLAAQRSGSKLVDVRKNNHQRVAEAISFNPNCIRVHTVGQDCSVGKMTVSLEIEKALRQQGCQAKFLATGQTGIMIRGQGVPIDCVVADFISGAAEQLVASDQDQEFLLIEGQGSLANPSFSAVTLGLLHGCAPHGLILCYEAGRSTLKNLPHIPTAPLAELARLYETIAAERYPCRVIGVAANTRYLSDEEAAAECRRVESSLGLPICDVVRQGPEKLTEAILKLRQRLLGSKSLSAEASRVPAALKV